MKHTNQKNTKILDELMGFCFKYGATKLKMELDTNEFETIIIVRAHIDDISEKTLIMARELLSVPRCHEMEEYYWNLSGDDDTDTEFTLVGMMTDEVEINYSSDKILEFKIKRFK